MKKQKNSIGKGTLSLFFMTIIIALYQNGIELLREFFEIQYSTKTFGEFLIDDGLLLLLTSFLIIAIISSFFVFNKKRNYMFKVKVFSLFSILYGSLTYVFSNFTYGYIDPIKDLVTSSLVIVIIITYIIHAISLIIIKKEKHLKTTSLIFISLELLLVLSKSFFLASCCSAYVDWSIVFVLILLMITFSKQK